MQSLARFVTRALLLCCFALSTGVFAVSAQSGVPPIRISQIYGGGGNSDATLHSDFIELFNVGPEAVNLNGWSVQYAAKEGTDWIVTPLGDVTIAGYGYLLIRQAAGEGGSDAGTALELPDVSGETSMSASAGKVALVAGTTAITGLFDGTVVDFVGYGDANEAETAPADKLTNTKAALRLNGGCVDTNDNALNFERLPPAPRNSSAPPYPCPELPVEIPIEAPTEEPTVLITPEMTATITETLTATPTETATADVPLVEQPPLSASPTVTVSGIFMVTPTDTPIIEEATPTPTATLLVVEPTLPESTPTATPLAVAPESLTPPRLLITEFLADPKAVKDEAGEWLEIYNADTVAVNLNGWTMADLDNDRHTIVQDLLIQPGQFLVLARNGDTATNGGVTTAYVYQSIALANSNDELLLFAPDGAEVDRVVWGDGAMVAVKAGASAQRTTLGTSPLWENSQDPWPGSAGDKGTPGTAYQAPIVTPTTTPPPNATPGALWPLATAPSDLQIEEVLYSGSDDEFIVLQNSGATPLDLTGWLIGDAETPEKGEGIYELPTGTFLAPGDLLVLARNGLAFRTRWGRPAHAEFERKDEQTPDLVRRRDLASGELALNDNGDEVLLFNPTGVVVDAVAFDKGGYTLLGLTGTLDAPKGEAIQRVPDARFPVVQEVRQRFLYAPPDPFTALTLPAPLPQPSPLLDDGLQVVWGSLGAQSIFSPDGAAPPHYLLALAAAQGLHFLAVADPLYVAPWQPVDNLVALPAWRWSSSDDTGAIVYNAEPQLLADQAAFLAYLNATGSIAQWQTDEPPISPGLTAISADAVSAPGSLSALYEGWFTAGAPLLPAGNAAPALPNVVATTPRYTGLAVAALNSAGVQDALATHRGWLTSRPGLWLALQAQTGDGNRRWMGATLAAENQITLHVDYGDKLGKVAGVAIWQDDKPIQQLATPLAGGRWSVTLPAMPNSFLYAVATQTDGDFAITAPIYVLPTASTEPILLNEVLPAPGADHNGDGEINSDDEFIELYNPGSHPVSLVGWQLSDAGGDASPSRRFTFGPGRFIGGRSFLLLRRKDTRINLNNDSDSMRLLNAAGEEVDFVAWAPSPRKGRSLSRLPDGGAWQEGNATPGSANQPADDNKTQPEPPDHHDDDEEESTEPPPVRLEPTHGQVGGPPASVAQSKLAGLEQWVEFRGVVTAPPGLYNATIYVADPAPDYTNGPLAGIGINVYLHNGEFPPLAEGDRVLVRGLLRSFRGEMELQLETPEQIWRLDGGAPLQPLPVTVADIGESLEGRLVSFSGVVSGWQGDSIFLSDPNRPDAQAVRVTVRSSLDWRRPYVNKGERWQVTGIVSQFARESPWNGGYRVLVRYKGDLVKVKK
ncbi:MAG: hypothetical protein DYG89_14235 [Caldilinea sp. CFX5]|nr:hypothetical protein [Caldilinea sp. CFX5]